MKKLMTTYPIRSQKSTDKKPVTSPFRDLKFVPQANNIKRILAMNRRRFRFFRETRYVATRTTGKKININASELKSMATPLNWINTIQLI